MKTEYEAKFIISDPDSIRSLLLTHNARCTQPEILMRRQTFHVPQTTHERWLRLRDEGSRVTLTLKQQESATMDGMKEIETVVHDFVVTEQLLLALGFNAKAYQENRREVWQAGSCTICIDTWPGLPPFIEIEGPTQDDVLDYAYRMGFTQEQALFGSIDHLYASILCIPREKFNALTRLTFEDIAALRL